VVQYVQALVDNKKCRLKRHIYERLKMKNFEAYVRIHSSGYIVKTVVQVENSQAAYFLLQGQYGQSNVVHLPHEV